MHALAEPAPEPTAAPRPRPPLDIGLVVVGRMGARQRRLVYLAGRRLVDELGRWLPRYAWRLRTVVRRDIGEYRREESSALLHEAAAIRDAERHDFTLLVTPDELIARYRSFALAALSRPLDAAVLSTARIVGDGVDAGGDAGGDAPRTADVGRIDEDTRAVDRLATLMLHALAHLAGLGAVAERESLLHRPLNAEELDAMTRFDENALAALDRAFGDVADTRLEESGEHRGPRWRFALRAARINGEEIVQAVLAARPWEFPRRLSRLTTAALSTLAVLLLTAESWDLGLSQGWTAIGTLALVVLALTTSFVVHRQQLLPGRRGGMREQLVVTEVSAVLIVVAGLATTWFAILALAFLAAATLFDATLVAAWATTHELVASEVGLAARAKMASFCASIGLLIGSLGASFEEQHHFRHVIFVDEEL